MLLRVRTITTGVQGAPYYTNSYLFSADDTVTGAQAAQDRVKAFWNSARTHMKSTATAQVQGDVAEIDIASGDIVNLWALASSSYVGTDTGDMLPPATQGLVRFRTGVYANGREVRGRMFLPAQMETDNVAGAPQASYVTFIQGLLNAYLTPGSPVVKPVIYSRTHALTADINAASLWSQWAVLRSRRD